MDLLWNQIRSHFGEIIDLPAKDRPAALAQLNKDAPTMAAEVRRLVSNFEEAKSFLEVPVVPTASQANESGPVTLNAGAIVAGRYEIRKLLGVGGMGEVYEAWDREMRLLLALKVLPPHLGSRSEMVDRFLMEVQLAREVAHPGVCKTFDLGRDAIQGFPLFFLTMELIDGDTLAHRLSQGSIPFAEGEMILQEAVSAIAAAHALNVVHRDLKPGNVMIRREPLASGHRVVIMDFGLAKGGVSPTNSDLRSATQQPVGTPQYMAPEQLTNEAITKATDVYAFGLIAYEVLTGRRPLDEEPFLAALIKRAKSVPPEARSVLPSIPLVWNALIARCLDPDPKLRFPDCAVLVEAMQSGKKISSRVPFRPAFSRRQIVTTTAGTAAAMTAGGFLWLTKHRADDPRVVSGTSVLLVPALNATGEPELDGLAVTFAAEIQQSAHLAFSQPGEHGQQLMLILKKPGDALDARTARHLALRVQIPLVLFATLGRVGSDYVFNVSLERVNPATEEAEMTWAESFRASNQRQLHTALYDAARWLRRTTGESETSIADFGKRPEEVTTDSWEALREFSKGEREVASNDFPSAVMSFERATKRDPLFAMAHMRRGDFCVRQRRFAEGYQSWGMAMIALGKRAISTREELMIRAMHADDMQNFPLAVGHYKKLMTSYPYLEYPWRYLSGPLMKMGKLEEALEVTRQWTNRWSGRWQAWRKQFDRLTVIGHLDEAKNLLPELKKRVTSPGGYEDALFLYSFAKGDYAAAEEAIIEASKSSQAAGGISFIAAHAHFLADRGRFSDAAAVLHDAVGQDAKKGHDSERSHKLISFAAIEALNGNTKPIRSCCTEALALDHGAQRVRKAGTLLARYGFEDLAEQAIRQLQPVQDQPLGIVAAAAIRSEILLHRKDFGRALSEIEKALPLRNVLEPKLDLCLALEGLGRSAEALEAAKRSTQYQAQEWCSGDLGIPGEYLQCRRLIESVVKNA